MQGAVARVAAALLAVAAGAGCRDWERFSRSYGVVDPDLLIWYPMDEGPTPEQEIADEARDHDGACAPCPSPEAGRIAGGYRFDGTQVIRVADAADLHVAAGTLAVWVYVPATVAILDVAVAKPYGSAGDDSFLMMIRPDGSILFQTVGDLLGAPAGTLPLARWVHMAGTWSPQGKRLYLDGAEVARSSAATMAFDTHDLLVGLDEDDGAPAAAFDGSLDDLRLYGRALGLEEIAGLAHPP